MNQLPDSPITRAIRGALNTRVRSRIAATEMGMWFICVAGLAMVLSAGTNILPTPNAMLPGFLLIGLVLIGAALLVAIRRKYHRSIRIILIL